MHNVRALPRPARFVAACLLLACVVLPASAAKPAASPPLIPLPAQWEPGDGQFVVREDTAIRTAADDVAAVQAATYFSDLLQRTRGTGLRLNPAADAGEPSIEFVTDPGAPDGAEAYALVVSPQAVRVRARTAAGLFYGGISLWQLLTSDTSRGFPAKASAVSIEDAPRFAWRGFMLDSARHFQSVPQIKHMLDQMAQHKLNVFHWHLTDDQGWRLEIKQYPKLTQIGAWRVPAGAAGRDENGKTRRYGGFYTQEQVRDIVAYATARHITIVPEIEMPGHAQAAIAAYPQFGVTGTAPPVSPDWGVHPYLYNVDDGTFTFLENVLTEVMALFPGQYIHVGGDEAVKDQWQASKIVQDRRLKLGLKDDMALQSWFIGRIERFLNAHQRKLIGWDEILEGGLPPQATVMSWRGTKGAVEAARAGHDVVLSPSDVTYLNRMQSNAADEPPSHDYPTPLKAVYDFEAVPAELDAAQARHVLGAQANLWTEHVRTFERVQHMTFPRLAALAEGVWTPKAKRDWDGFLQRLAPQMQRYRRLDVAAADSAFAVRIDAITTTPGRAQVTLANQVQFGDLRYTADGSEPTAQSPAYVTPIELPLPVTVKAASFADGQVLAATRTRALDADVLRSRQAEDLVPCSNQLVLRLEDDAPHDGPRAVLPVDILDACWMWKGADLDGIGAIRAVVANLPYNFQLGEAIKNVKLRSPASESGELAVRLDRCDGEQIATLPLTTARKRDALTTVEGPLSIASGKHDLCLYFTGRQPDPLWAIDSVQLLPASAP